MRTAEVLQTPAPAALLVGAPAGQKNAGILEGHLPGSCWALTRRIVQQLLLDRSPTPLTLLMQRLDVTLGAAIADGSGNAGSGNGASASAAGRTTLATVGRRIYDIGSVLSTFGLVQKSLQGGRCVWQQA